MSFFSALWKIVSTQSLYESMFRFTTFLTFAAAGEWVAEKAGTLNISVEAMLLCGAYATAVGSDLTHSTFGGLCCGALAGLVVAALQANLSHRLTANPFVVGLTLNVLAAGLTAFLDAEFKNNARKAAVIRVPLLHRIPGVGTALFANPWPAYLIYAIVPGVGWLVHRTRWGLEVRSVGENPQAADVSGIHVNKRRRQAIYVCGITSGLGGAYLILGLVNLFTRDMTGGQGFIAIAAVIFGGWTLRGAVAGCLVFGTAEALASVVPNLGYRLSPELLSSFPYVLTLFVMLFFARRTRQPASLARPFVRGLT